MAYEMELTHRIYSDNGYVFEVRPDPDGLGLIEVRYFEDSASTLPRQAITLTEESIPLIIKALQVQLTQIKEAKEKR